jgi:hypothetical protein
VGILARISARRRAARSTAGSYNITWSEMDVRTVNVAVDPEVYAAGGEVTIRPDQPDRAYLRLVVIDGPEKGTICLMTLDPFSKALRALGIDPTPEGRRKLALSVYEAEAIPVETSPRNDARGRPRSADSPIRGSRWLEARHLRLVGQRDPKDLAVPTASTLKTPPPAADAPERGGAG